MINLHSHSLLSDGCLLPSELAVRYAAAGYRILAITDHVDASNIEAVVRSIVTFCRKWPSNAPIKILPGVELTHLPLQQFKPLARFSRKNGIKIIIAHGQTPAEPVIPGTNQAGIEAGIDILAHPGRISDADAKRAKQLGVFLEVTSRRGHCKTNRFVAHQALKFGCRLVIDHDSHDPQDIISPAQSRMVGTRAGLTIKQVDGVYRDAEKFLMQKGG